MNSRWIVSLRMRGEAQTHARTVLKNFSPIFCWKMRIFAFHALLPQTDIENGIWMPHGETRESLTHVSSLSACGSSHRRTSQVNKLPDTFSHPCVLLSLGILCALNECGVVWRRRRLDGGIYILIGSTSMVNGYISTRSKCVRHSE